ncbi:hypothetical protein ACFLV4_00545 [Chloroflexota bacterium]
MYGTITGAGCAFSSGVEMGTGDLGAEDIECLLSFSCFFQVCLTYYTLKV